MTLGSLNSINNFTVCIYYARVHSSEYERLVATDEIYAEYGFYILITTRLQ